MKPSDSGAKVVWPAARPWLTLALIIPLLLLAFAGLQSLEIRSNYRVYFDKDNVQLNQFDQMEKTFSRNDNVAFVLTPKNGDIYSPETLDAVRWLTEQAWQTPFSTRVDSLTNFQYSEADGDDLYVGDLLPGKVSISPDMADKVRRVAMTEPTLLGRVVARDGGLTMVNVTVQTPQSDADKHVRAVTDYALSLKEKFDQAYPDIDTRIAGMLAVNRAFGDETAKDGSTLIPLMLLIIMVVSALLFRSVGAFVGTFVVVIFSIVGALGFAGWVGIPITSATINAPVMILTLAVADCIHIVGVFRAGLQKGLGRAQAASQSFYTNLRPVVLTSVTTAIGFLTLNGSNAPPIRDLGNLVAFGVMLAMLLALTVMPAMLRLIPAKVKPQSKPAAWLAQLAERIIANRRVLLPVTLLVSAGLVALAPMNELDDRPIQYFSKDTTIRQTADYVEQNHSGMTYVEVALDTGEDGGISNPAFLATLGTFTEWLRTQPEVDHVVSLSDVFKRLNKNMNGDDPAFYTLPQDRELASQYLLLYEMSLPYGLDLNNIINVSKSSTRLLLTLKNIPSSEIVGLEERIHNQVAFLNDQIKVQSAGPYLIFAHISETNMDSMVKASILAFVLISLVIGISLRSWRLALVSLVPNVLPVLAGFGMWTLIDGTINMGMSIVCAATLGIVVDDTVHFLTHYHDRRKQGAATETAIVHAFTTAGKAMLTSTVVLALGFAVLTLSNYKLNIDIGYITVFIVTIALILDAILLPTLLMIFDRHPKPVKERLHETAQSNV